MSNREAVQMCCCLMTFLNLFVSGLRKQSYISDVGCVLLSKCRTNNELEGMRKGIAVN